MINKVKEARLRTHSYNMSSSFAVHFEVEVKQQLYHKAGVQDVFIKIIC